jgi:uncharacterized protein
MVQVSYPGVYIQEVSSGVKTITGVATSITAFFGRANKGPINQAVRCLSYADFLRNFGGAPTGSELALSIKQFYDNGGTDCYVVRLANGAAASQVTLRNYAGTNVLIAHAIVEGLWGNGLRLEVDYNTPNPGETFNLRVYQEDGGQIVTSEAYSGLSMDYSSPRYAPTFVTQSSDLIKLELAAALGDPTDVTTPSFYNNLANTFAGFSQARRALGPDIAALHTLFNNLINGALPNTRFDISVNDSAYVTVDLSQWTTPVINGFAAVVDLQNDLQTRINAALNSLVPAPQVSVAIAAVASVANQLFLTITSANGAQSNVRIRRSSANDLAADLMLGADNGGLELARRSNFRPAPTGTVLRIDDSGGALGNIDRLNTYAGLHQDQITSVTIDGTIVNLAAPPSNLQTTAAGDPNYLDALSGLSPSAHHDGVREKLRIMAAGINAAPGLHYRAEVHGYQLVILAKDGTFNQRPTVAFGGPSAAAVNAALTSNIRQYTLGTGGTALFSAAQSDGTDGNPNLLLANFVGDPVTQTGFHALDTVDLFNLMVIPRDENVTAAVRAAIPGPASIYCQSRRAFLVIEAPDEWTNSAGRAEVVQNTSLIEALRATVVKDYSAVFYPKVVVNDNGNLRTIGAGGAIAGLMARTDANRGVWKAPAGTEADLRGLTALAIKLTDLENGVLNKLGVNCSRSFISGFVNWGARTLDGADDLGSEYKYIPIRRLALFIEESLYRGTQWVVFEPNDEPLWAKIRLNVGAFMNGLFRQGAFQGTTASQAFYVKCDSETTTQADRNLGIVNIEVGFAPLKPAEFVVIKIQQIAGDLS